MSVLLSGKENVRIMQIANVLSRDILERGHFDRHLVHLVPAIAVAVIAACDARMPVFERTNITTSVTVRDEIQPLSAEAHSENCPLDESLWLHNPRSHPVPP